MIFCIGIRSGSQSIKYALQRLGYRVYGMGVAVQYYSHLNIWHDHARGIRKADFAELLAPYGASVGLPCMFFPEDMLAAFPDARVIINMRDPAAWYKSYRGQVNTLDTLRKVLWFLPRMRAIYRTLLPLELHDSCFAGHIDDEAFCVAKVEELRARARKLVPPDHVLVHTVSDGWEPLCKFLGVPVPDGPYPHINKNESEVKKRVGLAMFRDVVWAGFAVFVAARYGLSWITAAALAAEAGLWLILYGLRRV